MEEVHCNLCGPSPSRVFRRVPDRLHGWGDIFTFRRCLRCGLVYLSPRPSRREMEAYYPSDYLPFARLAEEGETAWHRWDWRYGLGRRRGVVEAWKGGGWLLDVGCATGGFLLEMAAHGWQVRGVEPSPWAATYARERLGLEVFAGTLEEAAFPTGHFDVITFWDTVEHLPDPLATLGEARRILREEGLLVVSLPNLDSWDAQLFGRYWAGLDVPRHLHVFTQDTIRRLLRRARFRIQRAFCFTGRYHSFAMSMRFLLESRVGGGWWRQALLRAVRSPLVRALGFPYFAMVDRLGRGATLTLVATKES